ncbi:MAG: DUF4143 domain-containing protein [Bdellovibrionaceae bacterium]|nr:DUF4143 domain-containing protein [Pseudobdellovibrionaceae bacterium]
MRLFAKSAGLNLVEVNLERIRLRSLDSEKPDVESVIREVEAKLEVGLSSKTLLFFDEIQQQPKLLPVLRYFYEEHAELPVVAAGSLLEFALNAHQFSMPVGRIEYFHLSPMSFFEFLRALGKGRLSQQVMETAPNLKGHHFEQLTEHLKTYLFTGGMPEAVKIYVETKSYNEVRAVQRSIMQTYRDDFPKYSSHALSPRVDEILSRLPHVLGKKIKYTEISSDYQAREIKKVLALLKNARLIHFCYHTNATGLPLQAQADLEVYKVYFLDVGLLNYMMGVSWESLQTYNDSSLLTKGLVAEQFAAQHLAYSQGGLEEPNLFYWLRDKKTQNAEVDFVLAHQGKVAPVEIKSGQGGKLKSLVQFIAEKKVSSAFRFDLKDRDADRSEIKARVAYRLSSSPKKVQFVLNNHHLGLIELLNEVSY